MLPRSPETTKNDISNYHVTDDCLDGSLANLQRRLYQSFDYPLLQLSHTQRFSKTQQQHTSLCNRMTGSGTEIVTYWIRDVRPTSAKSYNHNTSEDTRHPRTGGRLRTILGFDNCRSALQAEQPVSERRRRYATRISQAESPS